MAALRLVLWHKFNELVPKKGEFSVGYCEGQSHTEEWLVSSQDLYCYYDRKDCVSQWCNGKEQRELVQKRKAKGELKSVHVHFHLRKLQITSAMNITRERS